MEIGMLWYDNSPTALKDRVKQAAGYYSEKYGRKPNLCFVHPDMLQADEGKVNGIVIRKGKQIMPGHFWIGVDEAEVKTNGDHRTGTTGSKPKEKSEKSKAAINSKTLEARPKPKTKAQSPAKKTAKIKAAKVAKAASAKRAASKPGSAKPKAAVKRVHRTRAYLKKKSGSRVMIGSDSKSVSKGTKSRAK